MKILVTGGLGFIGSHTVVELIHQGHSVHIIDNLCNSDIGTLDRIHKLVGTKNITFSKLSLFDYHLLEESIRAYGPFKACIHFAGLKAVGESVKKPLKYYYSNLVSTINLIEILKKQYLDTPTHIIFSSSATVYGSQPSPLKEDATTGVGITNPYGLTKHFIEHILRDEQKAYPEILKVTILRYFNPVGAHPSGLIGENPEVANNLMPYIQKVLSGEKPSLSIFGNNYPTKDGTCVRDFIHVVDLAKGHIAALKSNKSYNVFNLGTGKGVSVLELVHTMEKVTGKKIPYKITDKRPGDLPELYANVDKAAIELNWTATLSLENICKDSWNWVQKL